MSRRLNLLALAAAPALLVACDSPPSALTKAKPGECYAVVGRDAAGAPKLSKTPCAGSPAAIAAACPAPAPGSAAPAAAAATAACPAPSVSGGQVRIVEAGGYKSHVTTASRTVHSSHRQQARQQTRARQYARRDSVAVSRGGSFHGQYARVEEGLAGGPSYHAERYERRDYAGREDYAPQPAYEREEHRDHFAYSDRRAEAYGSQSREYGAQHKFHAPPPPPPPAVYERRGYAGGSVEYSEQQRSSSSYRAESYSSSSSSARGRVEVECDCDRGGHGRQANPSPFDHNGFLTWRGKTPG